MPTWVLQVLAPVGGALAGALIGWFVHGLIGLGQFRGEFSAVKTSIEELKTSFESRLADVVRSADLKVAVLEMQGEMQRLFNDQYLTRREHEDFVKALDKRIEELSGEFPRRRKPEINRG